VNQKNPSGFKSTAAKIVHQLENMLGPAGLEIIEKAEKISKTHRVIDNTLLMMFKDSSVLFIEEKNGDVYAECISAHTILQVLAFYRPFTEAVPCATFTGTKQ